MASSRWRDEGYVGKVSSGFACCLGINYADFSGWTETLMMTRVDSWNGSRRHVRARLGF